MPEGDIKYIKQLIEIYLLRLKIILINLFLFTIYNNASIHSDLLKKFNFQTLFNKSEPWVPNMFFNSIQFGNLNSKRSI